MQRKEKLIWKTIMPLLPIALMIGFVPLIVHTYLFDNGLAEFEWYYQAFGTEVDTFLGWKMIAIIVLGTLMGIVLLYQLAVMKEKVLFENAFWFMLFYGLFVLFAALFSPYKQWVLKGMTSLHEPVWVVISYLIVCYYTYYYVQSEKQVKVLLAASAVGVLFVCLIGVFQFLGKDIFRTDWGLKLIVDPSLWGSLSKVEHNMDNVVASTLYNPNYASFYFGMLIPISLAVIFGVKNLLGKMCGIVFLGLACVCMYGAHVSAGVLSLVLTAAAIVLLLASRKKRLFVTCLVVYGMVFVAGCIFLATTSKGESIRQLFTGTYQYGEEGYPVYEIRTEDDYGAIVWNGEEIRVSYEYDAENGILRTSCLDSDLQEISRERVEGYDTVERFTDARFPNGSISAENQNGYLTMKLQIGGHSWSFTKEIDGTYYYFNPAEKFIKIKELKRVSWFNEDAMSGRGRIWNRTIPLLWKHILVGSGANTFPLEYPQYDYCYRMYSGEVYTLDAKAHSWYLQQMVETGMIGTLLLLVFLGWYVVQSVRIYRKVALKESLSIIGLGVFAAILTYLFAGIVNDSMVVTAPVFWALLGLGMAINAILRKQLGELYPEKAVEEAEPKVERTEAMTEAEPVVSAPKQKKKQSRKQRRK